MKRSVPGENGSAEAASALSPELAGKFDALKQNVRSFKSVLVAYSGGVDSALVALVAHQELGDRALACIGISPSYPVREMRSAVQVAEEMCIPYRLIDTEEYLDADYAANRGDRCYHCKSELHHRLQCIAQSEGWDFVADGTNAGDLGDYRPGIVAAREHGVRSPLVEAALDKAEVRQIAHHLGLPVWDKPAMACLSSRVPAGTPITPELLKQIEAAEDVLVEAGFRQFRVRHHGEIARLELLPEDFSQVVANHGEIVARIRATGYRYVTLDLAGFRSGGLQGADQSNLIPLSDLTGT